MGFLVAALFFLRFWWRTSDGLFAAFALAFLLFAVNQALITGIETSRDEKSRLRRDARWAALRLFRERCSR